jgi:predicted dehydrogenase
MSRYRVGIIGLGRISSTIDDEVQGNPMVMLPYAHTACFREVDAVEVVAAADPFDEQRAAFGERWGVTRLYADYREMLEKEHLDIVSVATSAKPRPEIVKVCAAAGVKGIYAEKPIALSLAEADEMVAACDANNVALAVGCTRRWDAWWQMVRKLIADGQIGRVLQVNASWNAAISHNGSHLIDLVRFLVGDDEVIWVFGESEDDAIAATDDDHRMNGYLAFAGGTRAFIRTWQSGVGDGAVEIIGETGVIRTVANGTQIEWLQKTADGVIAIRPIPRPQRIEAPGVTAIRDLVAGIETGKKPECSGIDGIRNLEIAVALRESHRRGGVKVQLPIGDRSLRILSAETLRGDLPVAMQRKAAAASR